MNLKEAFRFQNKLQSMMAKTEGETTVDAPFTEYSEKITDLAGFLLTAREKLSAANYQAKGSLDLPAGLDGEVILNDRRQDIACLLRRMVCLRNGEVLIPSGGTGCRFNNEGKAVWTLTRLLVEFRLGGIEL